MAQLEHGINPQATKPTRLRCLPLSALSQIAGNDPRLGFRLYEALASELAATRELLLTTGQRSASERLVAFLLALSRRNERRGQDRLVFDLPMTRSDIADFLGLTVETVSRTFTKLKMAGLIDLPQSGRVRLLDMQRLKGLESKRRLGARCAIAAAWEGLRRRPGLRRAKWTRSETVTRL